jgi:cytochrome c oxidase assembly protein subunit 15
MVPEMSGGVFWEHLHRLVAGGLLLMFALATWLAHREVEDRPWILKACWGGIALLLVQSVFGGLTVLFRLPDLVSTTHLALAFGFLALATVLAAATSPGRGPGASDRAVARDAGLASGLVFAQSVLGGLVRHMDAGMACPDAPLCLGQVVPPLINAPIIAHFSHRVLALIAAAAVLALAVRVWRRPSPRAVRRWAGLAVALVALQVGLGVVSVLTVLAVAPVSLHTLVAAALLATLVCLTTLAGGTLEPASAPEPAATA